MKIYKSSNYNDVKKSKEYLDYLTNKDSVYEIKEISLKRTNLQNKSIHLFFTWCSDALNDTGAVFDYKVFDTEFSTPYTDIIVKEHLFKPILFNMFKVDKTSKASKKEISEAVEVLLCALNRRGLDIKFPNLEDKNEKTH